MEIAQGQEDLAGGEQYASELVVPSLVPRPKQPQRRSLILVPQLFTSPGHNCSLEGQLLHLFTLESKPTSSDLLVHDCVY